MTRATEVAPTAPDEEGLVKLFYGRAEVMVPRAYLAIYGLVEGGQIDRETFFAIAHARTLQREARGATRH